MRQTVPRRAIRGSGISVHSKNKQTNYLSQQYPSPSFGGGGVLLTEIPLPRTARYIDYDIVSIRGYARKARTDEIELDEGFQPCHPPFPLLGPWPDISTTNHSIHGTTSNVFLIITIMLRPVAWQLSGGGPHDHEVLLRRVGRRGGLEKGTSITSITSVSISMCSIMIGIIMSIICIISSSPTPMSGATSRSS